VSIRDGWKITKPEEQMMDLIRRVNKMWDERRFYTKLQGIRLESRRVLISPGVYERRLYAVVEDETVSNNNASYQIAP